MKTQIILVSILTAILANCSKPDQGSITAAMLLSQQSGSVSEFPCGDNGEYSSHSSGQSTGKPDAILIVAGQSNSVGFNWADAQPDGFEGAATWSQGKWNKYNSNSVPCTGPEYEFMRKWTIENPGKKLGLLHAGIGGTSMGDWQVSWDASQALNPKKGSLYAKLMSMYEATGKDVPVVAVLWVQGEADAIVPTGTSSYKDRTSTLFAAFKSKFNAPIVFARTSAGEPALLAVVRQAQTEVDAESGVALVETDDIQKNEDHLHFSVQGEIKLGGRMFDAWKSL